MKMRSAPAIAILASAASAGGFLLGVGTATPSGRAPLVAATCFLPEAVPARAALQSLRPDAAMAPLETYRGALEVVRSRYYGSLPSSKSYSSDQTLTYAAIRGMLASLNDRYTRFLTPDEYQSMMEENRGEFSGIGAHLDSRSTQVIVVDTIEGSPARKAGIKGGDRIIKVDGKSLEGVTVDDAVKLIRGPRGTAVTLTVVRKGAPKPLTFRLVREMVEFENVKTDILPGNIGYISLAQFNDQSDRRFAAGLAKLQAKKVRALIVDLRWNPGGLLEQAVAVASHFVREGPIVWIKERGGRPVSMDADRDARPVGGIPVVILVNRFSASASEVVSGAVKDRKAATLVGTRTWGKGLVQTINPISTDGSAVLITTHRYYTPAMVDINKKGIEPDVVAEVTEEGFARYQKTRNLADDPQVQKAVQVLRQKLVMAER